MGESRKVDVCRKCADSERKRDRRGYCSACLNKAYDDALAWQERDELSLWLSTRDNDWLEGQTKSTYRMVTRLRRKAEKLGIDWRQPPERTSFEQRVAISLTGSRRLKSGRPKQDKGKLLYFVARGA